MTRRLDSFAAPDGGGGTGFIDDARRSRVFDVSLVGSIDLDNDVGILVDSNDADMVNEERCVFENKKLRCRSTCEPWSLFIVHCKPPQIRSLPAW
jgi:hypothetical protein